MKNEKHIPAFVLAGTNSGCGKTTATVGLLALLAKQGAKVQAFKAGPDYIDPAFHAKVLGCPSYNLDTQMLGVQTCRHLFHKHMQNAEIGVVEGVMGVYDGMGKEAKGSTAELAKSLQLPVILVVNAKGMYQSVAAIAKGFVDYDPELNVAGFLLNHVGSKAVYSVMKQSIEDTTGVTCIGYLPNVPEASLESRHLGLIQAEEIIELDRKIEALCTALEPCIDIDALWKVAQQAATLQPDNFEVKNWEGDLSGLKLGVARDRAFSFYYADNLELLQEQGAELQFFSPLTDQELPADCNALYFGGGYPEVFALDLAQNTSMLNSIRKAAEDGMPIYGECGGLMYLCQGVEDLQGEQQALVGVFNAHIQMSTKLKRFGYCEVNWQGEVSSAHEFHRSDVIHNQTPNYQQVFDVSKPNKNKTWQCGLRYKNVVAGYPHVHFYAAPNFYKNITKLWLQTKFK